jgi:hypothetical protein
MKNGACRRFQLELERKGIGLEPDNCGLKRNNRRL